MTAGPQLAHTSIRLLAVAAIVSACTGSSSSPPKEARPVEPSPIARPGDAAVAVAGDAAVATPGATVDAAAANTITFTITKPRAPGTGLAKRCALGGDPLTQACGGGGTAGLAFDRAAILHLAHGTAVHRFKRAPGDACVLAPHGSPIPLPGEVTRSQRIDGPVYMRSGGPPWKLTQTGDAIYAHDFLAGLYRIAGGKAEPVCTDLFGFTSIAKLGKRLLIGRKGIEQLDVRPRGACKARSAGIDDKVRGSLHVIRDTLYVAHFDKLLRYDGTVATPLADGPRKCALKAVTPCGDGLCAIDNNCPQLLQLAADDTLARVVESETLFDTRPYTIQAAATATDGSVFILVSHRDKVGDVEFCEAAVYEVPAAMFER